MATYFRNSTLEWPVTANSRVPCGPEVASRAARSGSRRPHRSTTTAAALGLALSVWWLSACSPRLDWRDFSWPEGGFTALMPAAPTPESRDVTIGAERVGLHLFSSSVGRNVYAVGYGDLPGSMDDPARKRLLKDAQAGFSRNVNGTTADERDNTIEGFPCREFRVPGSANGRAVVLAARLCATDRRFYQLVYIGPAADAPNADIPLFLGSLKLLR